MVHAIRLARALQRYDRIGDAAAVYEAVSVGRAALDVPLSDPELDRTRQVSLGVALQASHSVDGNRAALDESIAVYERALASASADAETARGQSLLGTAYLTRFRLDGGDDNIDQAVAHCRVAVDMAPDEPEWQGNLSQALWLRHANRGAPADLEEAVDLARRAANGTPPGHADESRRWQNVGSVLLARYQESGVESDLDEGIAADERALGVVGRKSFGEALCRSALCAALTRRFQLRGHATDLDDAIAMVEPALELLVDGNPDRPIALYNCGAAFEMRFRLTGSTADLDEAIAMFQTSLAAAQPTGRDATFARSNLGNALRSRFELTGRRGDIDMAIDVLRAMDPSTTNREVRPSFLNNLAAALSARFDTFGAVADLDEAIAITHQTLAAAWPGHPGRARYQANLGGLLQTRGRDGEPEDLDEAIAAVRAGVRDSRSGDPEQGGRVLVLSRMLLSRFRARGTASDLIESSELAYDAARAQVAPADIRMEAARLWAELATERDGPTAGLEGWRYALDLLPLIAWQGIGRADQERRLYEVFGLASAAAATAISAEQPELAVEFLEHGRSVIWNQILDARGDFAELTAAAPELSIRLAEVRAALDIHLAADLSAAVAAASTDRTRLAREWDQLIDEVRRLPGFAELLRPPRFDKLAAAACDGPVVIVNVSVARCDALIVTTTGVRVVPLPNLTAESVVDHVNEVYAAPILMPTGLAAMLTADRVITALLEWLWRDVVSPIVAELGAVERIWWSPTGYLTLLPLHAATDPGTGTCAADRFVSSYAPTLRSLIAARATIARPDRGDKVLVVAVPRAPGAAELNVGPEIEAIRTRFGDRCLVLDDQDSTRERVLAELPRHHWVHFACHGSQQLDNPSTSALILHDHPLTVLDLAGLHMTGGELAFLSACETAGGGALPDESIHLAAALQVIGFRHVAATFWPVYDAPAPIVTEYIYDRLSRAGTATDTGRLLHEATRELRTLGHPPIIWAPYAHFGP